MWGDRYFAPRYFAVGYFGTSNADGEYFPQAYYGARYFGRYYEFPRLPPDFDFPPAVIPGAQVCACERRRWVFTLAELEEQVCANSCQTTCPVCSGGVDPESSHREPYPDGLFGSAAQIGYPGDTRQRQIKHTQMPDGTWRTTVSFSQDLFIP